MTKIFASRLHLNIVGVTKSCIFLLQYHLPLELLSREQFTEWMEVIRQVADRPVPDQTLQVDEEERPDLPWWKIKKWALHILARIFERLDFIAQMASFTKAR